ncbi:MAG: preprotein translocase subunit SecE [Deltaproteobacteria bacterium]
MEEKKKTAKHTSGEISAQDARKGITGYVEDLKVFLSETRLEFGKIHWPTRKEATSLSAAVLMLTLFFTAYLGVVDGLLSRLVGILLR